MFDSGLAHTWLFCTKLNLFRLWKEQRLGQYGRKEAPIKEALIPSTSEASIATSAGSVQIPRKSSQQGDQEVRPPPKNGITWGPVGSAGSPKSKKKGEKFRCCSVMWSVLYHVRCDACYVWYERDMCDGFPEPHLWYLPPLQRLLLLGHSGIIHNWTFCYHSVSHKIELSKNDFFFKWIYTLPTVSHTWYLSFFTQPQLRPRNFTQVRKFATKVVLRQNFVQNFELGLNFYTVWNVLHCV